MKWWSVKIMCSNRLDDVKNKLAWWREKVKEHHEVCILYTSNKHYHFHIPYLMWWLSRAILDSFFHNFTFSIDKFHATWRWNRSNIADQNYFSWQFLFPFMYNLLHILKHFVRFGFLSCFRNVANLLSTFYENQIRTTLSIYILLIY